MAYATFDTPRIGGEGLKARYYRMLDGLAERSARRGTYRRTVAELSMCSDRDLADFGIHRSEIPRIARKAAGLA